MFALALSLLLCFVAVSPANENSASEGTLVGKPRFWRADATTPPNLPRDDDSVELEGRDVVLDASNLFVGAAHLVEESISACRSHVALHQRRSRPSDDKGGEATKIDQFHQIVGNAKCRRVSQGHSSDFFPFVSFWRAFVP
jgi:hypothetical protein